MTELINRRLFLKKISKLMSRIGMLSLIPVHTFQLPGIKPQQASQERKYQSWLDVLSKGVDYIPVNSVIDVSTWDNEKIKMTALEVFETVAKQNMLVNKGKIELIHSNMDIIISNNKTGQYLIQKIKGKYTISSDFPEVTSSEDPRRSTQFLDLAKFILKYIIIKAYDPNFSKFSNFDTELLFSGKEYLKQSISINKRAIEISPEASKKELMRNLAAAYNMAGLFANFLMDVETAKKHYEQSLEFLSNNSL